nr:hypothetical protein [Candidatus Njordarchaeota archaeon]
MISRKMKLRPETKDIIIDLVLKMFGALVILAPSLFEWLVGIGFLVAGTVQILPSTTKKIVMRRGFEKTSKQVL